MPVNTPRSEYKEALSKWQRCRDCYDGSDAVKKQGIKYLPSVAGDYSSYLARAEFYNATARTVMGMIGCVFRSRPSVIFPKELLSDLDDVTLTAKSIQTFALSGFQETLIVGRWGVQVEMTDAAPSGMGVSRPYWISRRAEDILSWDSVIVGGREKLSCVVLSETVEVANPDDPWVRVAVPQVRVLQLLDPETDSAVYVIRRFQQAVGDKRLKNTDRWEEVGDPFIPLRRGEPLRFIPFQFFGPSSLGSEVSKPPLLDLVDVNLSHYRTSADHEHGAHLTSLPTPWVSGVELDGELPIGSSKAWVLPEPTARAGMLEYTGDGLGSLERLIAAKQSRMAALGARIIEEQKRVGETAEALRIKSAAEYSVLSALSATFDAGMQQVMKWHAWWAGMDGEVQDLSFALNKDFFDTRLSPQEAEALVGAWQSGAVSYETLFWNLQQGEWIESGRTLGEERELINSGSEDVGGSTMGDE